MPKARKDNYEFITNQIVELFEKVDAGEWRQPWATAAGFPQNGATGRAYRGVNVLLLWAAALSSDYQSNEWFTFNQAKELGGMVRKGEKSRKICFLKIITKDKDDEHEGARSEAARVSYPVLRVWSVFNRDQIDGLPPLDEVSDLLDESQRIACAQAFIDATGAEIAEGHNRAAYSPLKDQIIMPDFVQFESPEAFYTTVLHELGHWTGHESRLERDFNGRFGDKAYAAEELVAELCSAFLSAELGLQSDLKDPARYLKSWIQLLKDDKYAIFTASRKAQDAAEFLKALQPEAEDAANPVDAMAS